jgi:hypothetical protein
MRAMLKKGFGLLLAVGGPAWFAYVIYGWITYTGVWRWLAEWELQRFGSYGDKETLLTLIVGPIIVMAAPVWVIDRLRPGTFDAPNPVRVVPAANSSFSVGKMLGIIAGVALLVGSAAGFIGYQKSQTPVTFETVDLAQGGGPHSRHVALAGIARTDAIVVLEKTLNGSKSEETYLPVTPPNWHKGDPVSFFLMPRGNGYAGNGGFQFYQAGTRPFAIQQTGTVFSDGLPGLVRTEFERRGVVMASEVFVLDTKVDADLEIYFGIAFASGLCLLVILMTLVIIRLKRPRPTAA